MTADYLASLRQDLEDIDRERATVIAKRDAAIRRDHASHLLTIADLSRITGLSRTMLYKIIDKEES